MDHNHFFQGNAEGRRCRRIKSLGGIDDHQSSTLSQCLAGYDQGERGCAAPRGTEPFDERSSAKCLLRQKLIEFHTAACYLLVSAQALNAFDAADLPGQSLNDFGR